MCIRDSYESVWGEAYFYSANNTVMAHIRNLRRKLETDPKNPKYIVNAVSYTHLGLLAYNYFSGEHITHFEEGRPLFVRMPDSRFNLANFMRVHLYT